MAIQVIVFAVAVAAASAAVALASGHPADPSITDGRSPPASSHTLLHRDLMEDYDETFAYNIHMTFLREESVSPPYHYTYGYDIFYQVTGESKGQFENRYGDVAVGTFYRVSAGGNRTTVEYTVDTPHGFQASVRRDVQTQPESRGFARLAGPLAFSSPAAPEGSRKTLLRDVEDAETASPHAQFAYKTHNTVMDYFRLHTPYDVSLGCQIWDSKTGRTRSYYEKVLGNEGEGRLILLEADGTQTGITISVNDTGFYATSPVSQPTLNLPRLST